MDVRVFWSAFLGTVAATVVMAVATGLLLRWQADQAVAAFNANVARMGRQADHAAAVARARSERRLALQRATLAAERSARTLDPAQRCVGHTVIDIHGASFVQHLGANGRPVSCTGRLATQRLR